MIFLVMAVVWYVVGIQYERRRYAIASNRRDDNADEIEKLQTRLKGLKHTRNCDREYWRCDCNYDARKDEIKYNIRVLSGGTAIVNYANVQFWPLVMLHHYIKSGSVQPKSVDLNKEIEAAEKKLGIT